MAPVVEITGEAKIKRLCDIVEFVKALVRAIYPSIFIILRRLGRVLLPLHTIQYFRSEGLAGHHLIEIEIFKDLFMQLFICQLILLA